MRLQDQTIGPDGRAVRRSNRVPNFLAIEREARSFDAVAGLRSLDLALVGGRDPVQVTVVLVSPRTFELLGVRPIAGTSVHRRGSPRRTQRV